MSKQMVISWTIRIDEHVRNDASGHLMLVNPIASGNGKSADEALARLNESLLADARRLDSARAASAALSADTEVTLHDGLGL